MPLNQITTTGTSPAARGGGRHVDAAEPAPLFHQFSGDGPEPFGSASPAFVNSFHATGDTGESKHDHG